MIKKASRKRPCRICRRWFLPNPRVKQRQKTCGKPKCQNEWHRKKCAVWNRKNADYFKADYLQKKIEASTPDNAHGQKRQKISVPKSRMRTGLPLGYVQELIGINQMIIIEYLVQLLDRRFTTSAGEFKR